MKYIVSNYGAGVSVGLLDHNTAQLDINLAHNIFDSSVNEYLFHGSINFNCLKQFRRFLAFKEYYAIWDDHWENKQANANNFRFWKQAFRRAKQILNNQVGFENFMSQMSANNNHYNIGYHQQEQDSD